MSHYTVIARSESNYDYTELYCLGIYSTLEKAHKIVDEHKRIERYTYVYKLFCCEVDDAVIIEEEDSEYDPEKTIDDKEEKEDIEDIDDLVDDETYNNAIENIENIDHIKIQEDEEEEKKRKLKTKEELLSIFNPFLRYKEMVFIYKTKHIEYYMSYTMQLYVRYNKLTRKWSSSTREFFLIIDEHRKKELLTNT